jgi:phosphoglycolate phosphatase-like HAD superfamily hydrolase
MNSRNTFILLSTLLFVVLTSGCTLNSPEENTDTDPLPSWNEGSARQSIVDFVNSTTDPDSDSFIEIPDRIAVFDNDGTLWSEKPVYFQFYFALDRLKEMAPEHPEWKEQQPFKAALENDLETLASYGEHGILEIVLATHTGMNTEEFESDVKDWINSARHPQLNRPFTDLVYQPMLELLDFLEENQFKTFIVSGGGIDFMRAWVEEVYGIPRERVVGSTIALEYMSQEGVPAIVRKPAIEFIDDKEGKPVGIQKHIGRRPVLAAGNSDGDLAMLQWTASGVGKRLMLYIHHTDEEREWAYDRNSSVGRLDKGLDEAEAKAWTVVDMKNDWKVIYPFELPR